MEGWGSGPKPNLALTRGREDRTTTSGRFGTEVRASVRAAFGRLLESVTTIIPRLLAAALVVLLFGLLALAVCWIAGTFFGRVRDLTVQNLVQQVAYYTVSGIGLIVSAGALGLDPQTVVTGLGLTSLALGFALKDIISNFISGILLLALRPFQIGDQIVVGSAVNGAEGSVERIELRATHIRAYDGD